MIIYKKIFKTLQTNALIDLTILLADESSAVVGGEDDQGVVVDPGASQGVQKGPYTGVQLPHGVPVVT